MLKIFINNNNNNNNNTGQMQHFGDQKIGIISYFHFSLFTFIIYLLIIIYYNKIMYYYNIMLLINQ